MSPGGDERAGPSPGSGSQPRSSFFVRADDGAMHAAGGPHGGRIVLAASLVLPVDVSPYFKRIETFCRPARRPRPRESAETRRKGCAARSHRGKTGGAIAGIGMTLVREGKVSRLGKVFHSQGNDLSPGSDVHYVREIAGERERERERGRCHPENRESRRRENSIEKLCAISSVIE